MVMRKQLCIVYFRTRCKINDYEEFSFEKWKELQESLSKNDDVFDLPRFKLEYGIKNLNDSLTALVWGKHLVILQIFRYKR